MKSASIVLDGSRLTIEDLHRFVENSSVKVAIAPAAKAKVARARAFLEKESEKKIVYGVNTGFGPMAPHIITRRQLSDLQYNLIRSHAAGMGKPLDPRYVLGAMVIRLNTLLKGYSGVSVELVECYAAFVNLRIIPVVPEHGAVGTSGDLVQLAHIALSLIGEGEVMYRGERQSTKKVLKALKMKPHTLRSKEGLALINGTAMMTSIAALSAVDAAQLLNLGVRLGGLALEMVDAFDDGVSRELHAVRPHYGQGAVAALLRDMIKTSGYIRPRRAIHSEFREHQDVHRIPVAVQEVYSLRCMSQIVGPVLDTLRSVWRVIETEMNSATDNPLVHVEQKEFLHGGNFHGDYIATAADQLKAGIVKLTMLFERQINFFLSEHVNRSFSPFLNLKKPGLTLALQGLQFVATSTTAESQSLAFPHGVHSISTNADNQDVVSMGTDAALIAARVIENAYVVAAIEAVTLAQAVECRNGKKKLSTAGRALYRGIRGVVPAVRDDRSLAPELEKLTARIHTLFFGASWFRRFLS